ncbi:parvulin-like peptidyl-prolyl isomerase [Anaerolinea thermolimosa]|nr:peptidylprolyl isomerase [Anaerolinea thermolimosa]GAP07034.1 parvulin-like peptidyl-prolyl isomerase [Anaerolinea thermolimosa]
MAKNPSPSVTTKKHLARIEKERQQTRYLVAGVTAIFVLVFALIAYGILDQKVFQYQRVVAQVGNEKITVREFQTETRFARFLLVRQYEQITSNPFLAQFYGQQIQQIETQLADPTNIGKRVLDQMIEDLLVAQEAKARGITVSDEEVEKGLQEAFGFYANGTPTPAPTSTPFVTATLNPTQEAWLPPTPTDTPTPTAEPATSTPTLTPTAVTPTPGGPTPTPEASPTPLPTPTEFTLEGYKTELGTFLSTIKALGYDEAHLRKYIYYSLLRKKVYDAITADVPTEGEKIWARHILVDTEEEAKQVIDRLNKGEDFAKLASEVSKDTGSKDRGGDLGWFTKGVMVSEFENAAFALNIGQISQPVKSQFGYHIIQLLGKQVLPLTDNELNNAKQSRWNEWLTQAKASDQVKTFDIWQTVVPTDPAVTPYAGQ